MVAVEVSLSVVPGVFGVIVVSALSEGGGLLPVPSGLVLLTF